MLHFKNNFRTAVFANIVGKKLIALWVWCNVYHVSHFSVFKKIFEIIREFCAKDWCRSKKRGEASLQRKFFYLFLFYLPYLFSICEKENSIAMFWTARPHSLGSCHFRGVWATCFPHKGRGVPSSALPKGTTSELAGLFSTTSHKCRAPSR